MEGEGNSWVGTYNPDWYERDYFTKGPYNPYMDFDRHNVVFEKILNLFNPRSVLDVGCAYGFMVRRFLNKGIFAKGCDISKWCEIQANIILPSGFFIRTPAWDLSPFANNSFDFLYCEGVLEHFPEDKIEQVFREFSRVSSRGVLGISYDSPGTQHHICNHDVNWWLSKIPNNYYLGITGQSLDRECQWMVKSP